MFKNAKVGERVWDFKYGWGTITNTRHSPQYQILVVFDKGITESFMPTGAVEEEGNQTLFWDEIKFEIPKKQLPNLEVDTKVIVWDDNSSKKYKQHFSHFNKEGKICVFTSGQTSWSSNSGLFQWDNWELVEEETK